MVTLLLLSLVGAPSDPPKRADTPEQALVLYTEAIRAGNTDNLKQILSEPTRAALEKTFGNAVDSQKLQDDFDATMTSRFGPPPASKQRTVPAGTSLGKVPNFAVNTVKTERIDASRVKFVVESGPKLPNGQIDGPRQEFFAVLENGSWKLELPDLIKHARLMEVPRRLLDSIRKHQEEILKSLRAGKYASRDEAQKAWDDAYRKINPRDLLGETNGKIPPPGPPPPGPPLPGRLVIRGDEEFVLPGPKNPPVRKKVEIRRAEKLPGEGLTKMTLPGSEDAVYVSTAAELTQDDIARAEVALDINRAPILQLQFTEEGAVKAAKLSKARLGKPIAFLIDGKLIAAPRVQAEIRDRVIMTGRWTMEEVTKMVRDINGVAP